MEKKNPYVTTIGFNKDDPDHIYVAEFLNSIGRGKGQYIVKAIMAYQNSEGGMQGYGTVSKVDYEKIRAFVLQVLEERTSIVTPIYKNRESGETSGGTNIKKQEVHSDKVELPELDEMAVNDIMASLSAFR